jgi:hypothetical protein
MHVKFPAIVNHKNTGNSTKFLALDKVVPQGRFLQIVDVPETDLPKILSYDPEWLLILLATEHLKSDSSRPVFLPNPKSGER